MADGVAEEKLGTWVGGWSANSPDDFEEAELQTIRTLGSNA